MSKYSPKKVKTKPGFSISDVVAKSGGKLRSSWEKALQKIHGDGSSKPGPGEGSADVTHGDPAGKPSTDEMKASGEEDKDRRCHTGQEASGVGGQGSDEGASAEILEGSEAERSTPRSRNVERPYVNNTVVRYDFNNDSSFEFTSCIRNPRLR